MKKYVIIAIALLIVFISVAAFLIVKSESERSLNLSKEDNKAITELFGTRDFDAIVRIHPVFIHQHFSQDNASIKGITDNAYEPRYYMMIENDYTRFVRISENEIEQVDMYGFDEYWDDFIGYALKPELVFDKSYEVESVYCLHSVAGEGMFIYYETDKGDFILHREYGTEEKTYLFSYDDFCNFSKEFLFYVDSTAEGYGKSDSLDISKYEFKENKTNGIVASVFAVLCFGAVFVAIAVFVKRIKAN